MRTFILIFFTYSNIFAQSHCANNMIVEKSNIILWSNENRLEINDFQAKEKPDFGSKKRLHGEKLGHSKFKTLFEYIKVESKFIFDVKTVFIKDKSWLLQRDTTIVIHEQIHFDLYEICVRRIRMRLISMNASKIKEFRDIEFSDLLKRIITEEKANISELHEEYDLDTYNNEPNVDKKWRKKVDIMLSELEECP